MIVAFPLAGADKQPLKSPGIAQDVISTVESPMSYDWRSNDFELSFGYGYFDEANNFENETYEIGLGFPQPSGMVFRINTRRVNVYQTRSSRILGRTPFVQDATVSRYELGATILYGLMEGRQITRLSPIIPDLENTLFALIGVHYSHPSEEVLPKRSRVIEKMLGREAVNNRFNLEFGLEWQVFLPSSFGLRMGWYMHRFVPAGDDLKYAPLFMTGLIWGVR